jgi:hypothetical protein
MLPPAPARLTITAGWPNLAFSPVETMRAITSVGPPGAAGTMNRTGRLGYGPSVWACALVPAVASIAAKAARRVSIDRPSRD